MTDRDPSLLSLESTLERNFPGVEVLDHDLELSERYRADLVAIEGSGRLVLVLVVDTEGDEPLLAALDALAFARHNAPVLAAHFGEPRLRSDQPPRVLLITQTFSPSLVERLRPLLDGSVELFEVREVKSARGENLYLTAVGGDPQVLAAAATTEDAFFARLAPDTKAIAQYCLERMARIDDELLVSSRGGRLNWSFRGTELARVELASDLLQGSVAPLFETRALRSAAQVDFFVEEALGRYVEALGVRMDIGTTPEPSPGVTGGPEAFSPSYAAAERDDGPRERSSGADLSEEEIRAFQE